MPKFIDLTGQKYGRLTVIERKHKDSSGGWHWLCKCECGEEKIIAGKHLRYGLVVSCGCFQKESRHTHTRTHGKAKTRIYKIWLGIKRRCFCRNSDDYENYGGRGITVCNEWKESFEAFYNWAMANGYNEKLTIDRIDVNGNYEPSNCRWVDKEVQVRNRRTFKKNSTGYNGITKTKSGKFQVVIGSNYKKYQIGTFETLLEAIEAREKAELKYWNDKE